MTGGPRTKRPFAGAAADPQQRQITSFFTKEDGPSSVSATTTTPPAPLNGPVLPPSVQANLLTVGMRVRKSVVEGYKTDPNSYSSFALWSDGAKNRDVTPVPAVGGGMRQELTPFCGIHKVGGLAVQPSVEDEMGMGMGGMMMSSQESSSSATSATEVTRKKRGYVDEEEEEGEEDVVAVMGGSRGRWPGWMDEEISPRSSAPAGWGNPRVMAMPKSRMGKGMGATDQSARDQENMVVDDFDEAPFLRL